MSSSVAWKNVKYEEVFEQELRGLRRRQESDPSCTVKDIEGVLRHLYIMDGADWYGRGDVQDITMAATIAAYEHFIAQWKLQGTVQDTVQEAVQKNEGAGGPAGQP